MPLRPEATDRTFLRSRVGRRLLGLLLGCALVPLLAFAWLAMAQVSARLQTAAEASLHGAAKSAGMALIGHVARLRNDLDLMRQELQRSGPGALTRIQPEFQERLARRFRSVWVQRADQPVQLELGDPPRPVGALARPTQVHLRSGGTAVARQPRRDGPGQSVLLLRETTDQAMLVGEIADREIWDPEDFSAEGAEVLVLAEDLSACFSTLQPVPELSALRAALATSPSSGTVAWQVAGEEHLARYWRLFMTPQFGADWIVVQTRATAAVLAPLYGFRLWFGLVGVLTSLFVVLVSLVQIRRTLAPIRELHAGTRRVAAGDYTAPVRVLGSDELGELAVSFNGMTRSLVENIRRREQTEQALVAARDAALAAARAKADFLTNVSHELRTPLTSILSAAEILRSYPDEDPALRAEFLGAIAEHAARLSEIVDKVLDLSSGGHWELIPTGTEATLLAARSALPTAWRARVQVDVAPDTPPVLGAHDRLVQLWMHLLDNAVKFSAPDTPVAVRARGEGDVVLVAIQDHGCGIAPADLPTLFEPFRQVGRDLMTGKARGTGLGLTLARHIVERHGGSIAVDSTLDQGTTFHVRLPAAPVAATRWPAPLMPVGSA